MATEELPGTSGEISADRCPMYGVVRDGRQYRITVQMRVRVNGGSTRPEGGVFAQSYLPETYKTQRQADVVMAALNMRVWNEIVVPTIEAVS